MKSLHAAFFFAFVASTIVQWNDPDWLPWAAIYAVAAWESGHAVLGRHERARALVVALVALAWLVKLSGEASSASWIWNEVQRESGGLLLVSVAMLAAWRTPVTTPDRMEENRSIDSES
jgi:Transmembrane family 220, helix